MIRKAIVMQVNQDCHDEYKKRHDEIPPDLVAELKAHGVHHYTIFLDKLRNLLFGYVEIEDEQRWNDIANTEACKKWWAFMKEIMPSNPDNSPISQDLEQVFYLD